MARFQRLEVLNEMIRIGLVPVFYHPEPEVARQVITACAEGGARLFEFTNRGDNAYRLFSDLVMHFAKANPDIILGVGSVLDPVTAALYIESGANFVVGPTLNPEVARTCNRRKVAYSPGCGSATEIMQAEELGVEIVKVFPGDSVGGPNFVKSMRGPMPWTRIMPTGGVSATQESIEAWFKAGVAAVGIGSDLARKSWVQTQDYDAICHKTEEVIHWIRLARGVKEVVHA
jgi:2-dehydro-3-deoxyphosphogluconate aldolase / (4S)-4-hydroxy-2-oxoglutarate aldolase